MTIVTDKAAHSADINRLPASIRHLNWIAWTERTLFHDGAEILSAVPVRHTSGWWYELNVVRINVAEGVAYPVCNEDEWGWSLSDIDFFVRL